MADKINKNEQMVRSKRLKRNVKAFHWILYLRLKFQCVN